ncbi:hypothetical protein B0H14DRAFT_794222 [Mycena olivaceomarginata]|nr:hypothetical protein B0H14DRAFT_794222 [Mycena olivaceomarginata]
MPAAATQDQVPAVASSGGAKRTRTTRRVNTAERRARHNAVERQRRETLNGRLLDLAALFPNLNRVRRPSKAAIVNSAITHLNASRRHRIFAAQQLRMMKSESDALRREVNQWRARAGTKTFLEPMRSEAFRIVIRGELEFEAGDSGENHEEAGVYGTRQYAAEPGSYASDEAAPAKDYALLLQCQTGMFAAPQVHHHHHQQQQAAPFAHAVAPSQGYPVHYYN